jgi:hypothetical protein
MVSDSQPKDQFKSNPCEFLLRFDDNCDAFAPHMHKIPVETAHYRVIACIAMQATRGRTICSSSSSTSALAVGEEVAWALKKS